MISRTQVLKYTLLPGILPRIYQVFATGFVSIPYFMAIIYQAVGILPRGHAYLDPRNVGRYGIRHVLAEAANHLVFDRRHADQVFIFVIILIGVVLLLLQLILLVVAFVAQKEVLAGMPTPILGPFGDPNRPQDLSFILLDRVFGVENMFYSCISTGAACLDTHNNPLPLYGVYPSPFHRTLHAMLQFYSTGIFFVAALVVIYFVIAVTAETAASGTPFGQRFNKAWAPVRLILAFALLVPINLGNANAGLNGAQMITLWSAKLGSNFATNAWIRFNQTLTGTYAGEAVKLIGAPNAPKINDLVKFMFIAKTCKVAENVAYGHGGDGIQAYVVREHQYFAGAAGGPDAVPLMGTDFATARRFSNNGSILIRFGALDANLYGLEKGNVKSFCGDVRVAVTKVDRAGVPQSGSVMLQGLYYDLIRDLWTDGVMGQYAACLRARNSQFGPIPDCPQNPNLTFVGDTVTRFQNQLNTDILAAINRQATNSNWAVPPELIAKGWAGAAIWYNTIAELNGDVSAAIYSLPEPVAWPYIMEFVAQQRRTNNENLSPATIFDPELAKRQDLEYPRTERDREIAAMLNKAYIVWMNSASYGDNFNAESQGPFIDTVNAILGTNGIFSMKKNTDIHPLAQLSILGKGMMYASIRNFGGGMALNFAGGAASNFMEFVGAMGKAAGSFLITVGKATMAMSFVLYYVIPFMPFIYFIFAVSGWLKAIFEAIVAMPLWALAHIRIDGEGMPGPAATQGYFLILEIFLRPILIVFGLLAGIQIFSALVIVLNQVFDLIVANLGGYDRESEVLGIAASTLNNARGSVDKFFFTAIYVIMAYMMGTGCFKLVDLIPNNIMRWIGASISPMTEQAGDAADQVLSQTYQGATLATQQISGGQLAAMLSLRR